MQEFLKITVDGIQNHISVCILVGQIV